MATEEPNYQIIEQYPDFELRRYDAILLAETTVSGDFDEVGGDAFRILADYIFGNNDADLKIAMTAPVIQQPAGETAQTLLQQAQDPDQGRYVISFVMPAQFTLKTLPPPKDARIQLREQPARLLAALRYSGGWSEQGYRERESRLLEALQKTGLNPVGAPIYARYNSPFSLPFMRRNEVMIEVRQPSASD